MRWCKNHYKLQKLSKEFQAHCQNDIAKKCILFSKLILQSLNVWPDNTDPKKLWLMSAVIVSVFVMGSAHFVYVIINLAKITKMTTACTTVLVSFECVAKLWTMIHYRQQLNKILTSIWLDFWPSNLVNQHIQRDIIFRSNYVTIVGMTFLFMAFFSNAQFMMFPLVNNLSELPLASWYPFDFRRSPVYEMMYIWQWFMNQVIITTLSGFDAFFNATVMICATQFLILQNVLMNIGKQPSIYQWNVIKKYNNKGDEEREEERSSFEMKLLVKCIKHHLNLIEICDVLEHIFAHIVFIQFVVSATAMCVSCVALIADPDVWQHMLSYLIAHVFQFFIYCSVGSELTYQSGQIAEAAYDCNWEASQDNNFRRALVMIILRAQKPMALTVAGLMQLSYANFIGTVQLSFSFYVLLDSFV